MPEQDLLSRIRAWLAQRVAAPLNLEPASIDFGASIDRLGLDSVEAVLLTGDLGEWLGIEVPPTLLYDTESLDAVCHWAAQQVGPEDPAAKGPPPRRLALAATFTAESVAEVLAHVLEGVGLPVEPVFAPYHQVFQALLDPASVLAGNAGGVNLVLVRVEDWFRFEPGPVTVEAARRVVEDFRAALAAGVARSGIPTVVALCPHTPERLAALGLADEVAALDDALAEAARAVPGVELLDLRLLEEAYRLDALLDPERDALGHIPYTEAAFAAIGFALARAVFRHMRPPAKVVVLDADNTLWSGVVGEDGPEGVQVSAPYQALQRRMLAQHAGGRLLCLASKNQEADVWAVFERHPGMVLRREHLAAWRIGWGRKSESLRELVAELNLGLDSFIFIDDNPAECAEVAAALPEVTVIHVPDDPARIPDLLARHWALDLGAATEEDQQRTAMVQQNRARSALRESATSFEQFLRELGTVVEFGPLRAEDVARCAQLTQRTNQFNTTTWRRSEAEVAQLLTDPPRAFTVRARDRFGDYGLIGFAVVAERGAVFEVESLLLSCRVLGKRVEHEVLRRLAAVAGQRGAERLRFLFQPSERNQPARHFLESLGLREVAEEWTLEFAPAVVEARLAASIALAHAEVAEAPAIQPAAPSAGSAVPSPALQRLAELNGAVTPLLEALRAQSGQRPDLATPFITPRTPLQRQIADIWRDILRLDRVGIYDSFFELGGDSLGSAELLARLYRLGLSENIAMGTLGDPTVAGLAQAIEDIREGRPPNLVAALASLEDEAVLPADLRIPPGPHVFPVPQVYFLTGASGYVGAYLLAGLLRETAARMVCHVRAASPEQGRARIVRNLQSYGLWREEDAGRIEIALGDLAAPRLGLAPEAYARWAAEADAVIHNGAWVNFVFPYQHLKPSNVGGTEAALRFALDGKLKPLHFISTLGVLMSGGYGRERTLLEDEALDHSEDLPNGYEQTKWVADKLVKQAMAQGLPASIYRLGMLSGLAGCGTYHKLSEFLPSFLKGCVQLGSFPRLDSKIEMVPVDFVARGAVRIILGAPASLGKVYHMNHPAAVTDAEFAAWIRAYGYPMRHVPWDVWKRELMSAGPRLRENALYPFLDFIRSLQAHQTYIPEMGMANFFGAIGEEVRSCPDQLTLLQRYFDYFVESGYLPEPAKS